MHPNARRALVLLVGLMVFLGVAGFAVEREFGRSSGVKAGAPTAIGPVNAGANVIRFVKDPQVAPMLDARDLDGNPVTIESLRGKVVIVNFWATWCPPCREEIPELEALQTKYKGKLQIIGISEDEEGPDKVRPFAQQKGMNYPIVMATSQLVDAWGGVPALPTSFVVDPQGRVVTKHMGLRDPDVYDREIRSLLGMPVDAKVETFVDTGQVFMANAKNATDLPDVDFSGLTPAQKKVALRRMNAEACTCGCGMTISECRINDEACPISKKLAADIVDQVSGNAPPKADTTPKSAVPAPANSKPL